MSEQTDRHDDAAMPEPPEPADLDAYRGMVGGGPSAAFFDLDRTLIAGSSAFIM